jgi:hypothetical protein
MSYQLRKLKRLAKNKSLVKLSGRIVNPGSRLLEEVLFDFAIISVSRPRSAPDHDVKSGSAIPLHFNGILETFVLIHSLRPGGDPDDGAVLAGLAKTRA